MIPDNTRPIRGARVIAKVMGVSERTVRRLVQKGALHAKKLNGPTSPWTASRAEIDRLRRGSERED